MEGQNSEPGKNEEEQIMIVENDSDAATVLDSENVMPMRPKLVNVTTYSELYPQEKRFIIRVVDVYNFYNTAHGRKLEEQKKCLDIILNVAKLNITVKMLKKRLLVMIDEHRSGKHEDTYKDVKEQVERIEVAINSSNDKKKPTPPPPNKGKKRPKEEEAKEKPQKRTPPQSLDGRVAPVHAIESASEQIGASIMHDLKSISSQVQQLEVLLATAREVEKVYSDLSESLVKKIRTE